VNQFPSLSAVASFAVSDENITLVENGQPVVVCVAMTVVPPAAILKKEVVVTLSAEENTGIFKSIPQDLK
jgi:3'-phosphoadenosine 5'-phosphosulfate (PAPS) 3'-phosphatase